MKLWPLIFRLTCTPCWQYELWGPNQYLRARWASVHAQTAGGIETNVGGIPGHYWFFNPYECSRIESGHSNTHVLGKTWRILHPKSGISIAQANSAEANSSSLQQQAQKLRVNGFGELFCWLFFQRCIFCFFFRMIVLLFQMSPATFKLFYRISRTQNHMLPAMQVKQIHSQSHQGSQSLWWMDFFRCCCWLLWIITQ